MNIVQYANSELFFPLLMSLLSKMILKGYFHSRILAFCIGHGSYCEFMLQEIEVFYRGLSQAAFQFRPVFILQYSDSVLREQRLEPKSECEGKFNLEYRHGGSILFERRCPIYKHAEFGTLLPQGRYRI
jgi:hypothetical protein